LIVKSQYGKEALILRSYIQTLLVLGIVFSMLGTAVLVNLSDEAYAKTYDIVVDDDWMGPGDVPSKYMWGTSAFNTISDAVDAASPGDHIFVYQGLYQETIEILTANLILEGEDRATTIIDGEDNGNVVTITADGVTFESFTIKNGWTGINPFTGYPFYASGIKLEGNELDPVKGSGLRNNNILHASYGITMDFTEETIISGNTIEDVHFDGLSIHNSNFNTIRNNEISLGTFESIGVSLYFSNENKISTNIIFNLYMGIYFFNSRDNVIDFNNVYYTERAIYLEFSDGNDIKQNTMHSSVFDGIHLDQSSDNHIFQNEIYAFEWYGIFTGYSDNNHIHNNDITDVRWGIYLQTTTGSHVHTNTITDCKIDGVYMADSMRNKVHRNKISSVGRDNIREFTSDNENLDVDVGSSSGPGTGNIYFVNNNDAGASDLNDGKFENYAGGADTNGDGKADGPWKTIKHGVGALETGDTLNIKSGIYVEKHFLLWGNGAEGNPITIQGYKNVPGDIPSEADRPKLVDPDPGAYVDYPFSISNKEHIILRNLDISYYWYGVYMKGSSHITLENIRVRYQTLGIQVYESHFNLFRNVKAIDGWLMNIQLDQSHYNVLEDCSAYGMDPDGKWAPDYYLLLRNSHDNLIKNFVEVNDNYGSKYHHSGWGIGIKDWSIRARFREPLGVNTYMKPHSYNNVFIDSQSYDLGRALQLRHFPHHNKFINTYAEGGGFFVQLANGASRNEFINSRAVDIGTIGIYVVDSPGESPSQYGDYQIKTGNVIENCIFEWTTGSNGIFAVLFKGSEDTLIKNCVFYNPSTFIGYGKDHNVNNVVTNTIVTDSTGLFIKPTNPGSFIDYTVKYSTFYNNAFATPTGTGILDVNPLFADPASSDFHLKSEYGRWDGSSWVLDSETSPAIDAGDPADAYSLESENNGDRINQGGYGNMVEASRSE
jgi:parallel beta-helix repeat protein